MRAGKSKTVEWMAFRWAKCEEDRDDNGRIGFLVEIGVECDVFLYEEKLKAVMGGFSLGEKLLLGAIEWS